MPPLRIIFMGTPDFAVPSLDVLVRSGQDIVAVITAADKPGGRGLKMTTSAVKDYALRHHIPVLQPINLKDPAFIEQLRSFHADLQVVVAFRMLPEVVWKMPPQGTFNLHASLLPQYRGAAPIQWAVINGEKESGVTTFFLEQEIDTGTIIFQEKVPIHADDTAGTLHDTLARKGADLVLRTVEAIEAGTAPASPQMITGTLQKAPKIFRETSRIDWQLPAERIRNFVRGLDPHPGAWMEWDGKTFKIFRVAAAPSKDAAPAGTIQPGRDELLIRAGDGWVAVLELQPEGKRRMPVKEFLAGYKPRQENTAP